MINFILIKIGNPYMFSRKVVRHSLWRSGLVGCVLQDSGLAQGLALLRFVLCSIYCSLSNVPLSQFSRPVLLRLPSFVKHF